MNRKGLVLLVIALCVMTLPTKMLANELDTIPKIESKKTLPYPHATEAIPVSALE